MSAGARPRTVERSLVRLSLAASALVALVTGFRPFALERGSGFFALGLLTITLAVTPMRRLLLGMRRPSTLILAIGLQRARRTLGLGAALAATAHAALAGLRYFGTSAPWASVLDAFADIAWLRQGLLALSILGVLALTSLRPIGKRLRAWSSLHRLIYVAAILGGLHALLGPHSGVGAMISLSLVALLLAARLLPRRGPVRETSE